MKKLFIGLVLATVSTTTLAIDITVGTGVCGGAWVGAVCTQLDQEVNDAIDEDTPSVSIGDYGTGIANANGFAQKGLGSDYSDVFTYFMVRGAAGAAVQGEINEPESADGFGLGLAATFGLNLDILPIDKIGPVELDKMDIFVSVMSQSVDQENGDLAAEGDFSALSVMARYQIMEGKDIVPGYMLEWGGIFIHTGFQRSSLKGEFSSSFDGTEVELDGGESAEFDNSFVTFDLDTTTTTIPVEVSTYLRTVWALTIYGGAGFDFVSGKTEVDLEAGGDINGSDGGNTYSNTISASDGDSGDADATNFRAFGGLQLNLPFFRVFAHANKGLGNDLIGVNVGAKILW